ncbi:unnamed protein product, partial [Anisakis simplex]|uniref:Carrier domain-containing protein n=1 Tax=Anisakis simplex TaxID=6269 RepID=A0A0M3JI98_ANISI
MYASGDVVKQLRNGDILFIGRRDEQVKIRGFRVELTEIEAVICGLPDVKQCKVILMQNSLQILVAYFTLRSGSNRSPDVDRIREFCKQRLPHYMIPTYFKELEQFPITKNNKIDITKLPMVSDEDHNQRLKDQPENVVEFRLWLLFKQVLLNESISTVDDFFAIGGNSLRAMLLAQRINEEFSANVSANIIYQYRTIRRIAELLNAKTNLHLHTCSTHAQVDDAPSIKIDYHS